MIYLQSLEKSENSKKVLDLTTLEYDKLLGGGKNNKCIYD